MNKHDLAAYEERKASAAAAGQKLSVLPGIFTAFRDINGNRCRDSGDVVRPLISFNSCLQAYAAIDEFDDFYSTAIRGRTKATK